MKWENDNILLAIGMLSLTLAVLLGRYFHSIEYIDFFEGLFYGLSIILNLGYLIRLNKSTSKKS